MRLLTSLLAAATLIVAPPLTAQSVAPGAIGLSVTGQPTAYDVSGRAYVLDGYRSAKWGMTPDQVRAAVARDMPDARLQPLRVDPVDRTPLIVANVSHLAPGPGRAAVTYIFGAKSGRLMHVNIDWSADHPTEADRQALTEAAAKVLQGLVGYYWKLGTVARGIALAPGNLSLFSAGAEGGGLIEVRLQGVGYMLKRPGAADVTLPPPADMKGLLHIGIAQDATPDVYRITKGQF